MVNIVICYQAGTGGMLKTCLSAIERHTNSPYRVWLVTAEADGALRELAGDYRVPILENPEVKDRHGVSNIHGALLDWAVGGICHDDDFILTLDSDCFPVADGWLTDLLTMIDNGARIAGILHPWAPPPEDMDKTKVEWRVRSQHCWNSTHVACQLIRKSDLNELGQKYNAGDDTGMAITLEAHKRGWKIDGFKPTRCPLLRISSMVNFEEGEHGRDSEFNRYSCVVFGDKVYHHGGYSRATMGDDRPYGDRLNWVTDLILYRLGAEVLLLDDQSHQYRFDDEEAVATEKMERLFRYKGRDLR